MEEKDIQEAAIKREYLARQFDALQKESAKFEQMLTEVIVTQNALKELEKAKEDKETLIPAGSGVFVNGVIKKADTVMTNMGENVVIEKSIKEVLGMLKGKEEAIKKNLNEIEKSLNHIKKDYNELTSIIESARK